MNIINWLEDHFLPCAYKQFFGIECPFCGSQRALIELLKGNIIGSIKIYPALIPVMLLVAALLVQMLFKLKHGWKLVRILLKADFAIIMISYFFKLLNIY